MVSAPQPARRHDDPPRSFTGKLLARVQESISSAKPLTGAVKNRSYSVKVRARSAAAMSRRPS